MIFEGFICEFGIAIRMTAVKYDEVNTNFALKTVYIYQIQLRMSEHCCISMLMAFKTISLSISYRNPYVSLLWNKYVLVVLPFHHP